MLRVTVFNASMSAHFSQLFAGLYDLRAAGLLEMHFRTTSERGCSGIYSPRSSCASACERLLDDPALAREMRRNNEDYYDHELNPPVLMMKRLHTAMAVEPQ